MPKAIKLSLNTHLLLRTVVPLILGVAICTALCSIILFTDYQNWIRDLERYFEDEEMRHLTRIVQARASKLSASLGGIITYTRLLAGIIESYSSGEVQLSDWATYPVFVNAYEDLKNQEKGEIYIVYPDLKVAEWFVYTGRDFHMNSDLLDILTLVDPFMRILYRNTYDQVYQYMVLQEVNQFEYRYPTEQAICRDIQYIQGKYDYQATCQKVNSDYDPICKGSYNYLIQPVPYAKKIMLYIEQDYITLFQQINYFGAVGVYLYPSVISDLMLPEEGKTHFLAHKTGDFVIMIDQKPIDEFWGKTLDQALFPDQPEFQEQLRDLLKNANLSTTVSRKLKGKATIYYIALTPMNLPIRDNEYEESYISGVMTNEVLAVSDWTELREEIYNDLIQQTIYYCLLVFITMLISILLNNLIIKNNVIAIDSLIDFLLGKISFKQFNLVYLPGTNQVNRSQKVRYYNEEINSLKTILGEIDITERFIDPRYLFNPSRKSRIKHLKKAVNCFDNIHNNRGIQICYNLLGNIHLSMKLYKEAIEYYNLALEYNSKLHKIIKQYVGESQDLTEDELDEFKQRTGRSAFTWDAEQRYIKETKCKLQLQVSNAMIYYLSNPEVKLNKYVLKKEWLKVKAMLSATLQYYIDTNTNLNTVLNILLDISYVLYSLDYQDTARELLEITEFYINMIDKSTSIDIDSARIRRVGIELRQHITQGRAFEVQQIAWGHDLLMQKANYFMGLVLRAIGNPTEACALLTDSIVSFIQARGKYYDPLYRIYTLELITDIMHQYELYNLAKPLQAINYIFLKPKSKIIMALYFNPHIEKELTRQTVQVSYIQFVQDFIPSQKLQFGAIFKQANTNIKLDICIRDKPADDMQYFIERVIQEQSNMYFDHLYEVFSKAVYMSLATPAKTKCVVLIIDKFSKWETAARLEDFLNYKQFDIQVIIITLMELPQEFMTTMIDAFDATIIRCIRRRNKRKVFTTLAKLLGLEQVNNLV